MLIRLGGIPLPMGPLANRAGCWDALKHQQSSQCEALRATVAPAHGNRSDMCSFTVNAVDVFFPSCVLKVFACLLLPEGFIAKLVGSIPVRFKDEEKVA